MECITNIKTKLKKIDWTNILFWTVLFLSAWAVLAWGFEILPLIKVYINPKIASGLLALSYSYLAGCVFYLLSVVFPKMRNKRTFMPVVKAKVKDVGTGIHNTISQFSTESFGDIILTDIESCKKVLLSREWNDKIDFPFYTTHSTYLNSFSDMVNRIVKHVDGIILYYKDYLNENQLILLEKIRDTDLTALTEVMNNRQITPEGAKGLTEKFCELIETFNTLENTFN